MLAKNSDISRFALEIVESIPTAVLVLDYDLIVLGANAAFRKTFQLSEHGEEKLVISQVAGGAGFDVQYAAQDI